MKVEPDELYLPLRFEMKGPQSLDDHQLAQPIKRRGIAIYSRPLYPLLYQMNCPAVGIPIRDRAQRGIF